MFKCVSFLLKCKLIVKIKLHLSLTLYINNINNRQSHQTHNILNYPYTTTNKNLAYPATKFCSILKYTLKLSTIVVTFSHIIVIRSKHTNIYIHALLTNYKSYIHNIKQSNCIHISSADNWSHCWPGVSHTGNHISQMRSYLIHSNIAHILYYTNTPTSTILNSIIQIISFKQNNGRSQMHIHPLLCLIYLYNLVPDNLLSYINNPNKIR